MRANGWKVLGNVLAAVLALLLMGTAHATDSAAPVVTITSPANFTLVNGTVIVAADATDDVAVSRVIFSITDNQTGGVIHEYTDQGAPYGFEWATDSLAEGPYVIRATAVDTSETPAYADAISISVDRTPPDTTLTSTPPAVSNSTQAQFGFEGIDAVTGYECSLDGAAYTSCSPPKTYSNLANGSHTFLVQSLDKLGRRDPSPASYTWTVDADQEAPTTTIISGPRIPLDSDVQNGSVAEFRWTGSDDRTTTAKLWYVWSLVRSDGYHVDTGWSTETRTVVFVQDSKTYTFSVYAIDEAGRADESAATHSWTADAVAPISTITSGPGRWVTQSSATVSWSGSDNRTSTTNLRYSYKLEDGTGRTWSAWSTGTSITLSNLLIHTDYTFSVRVRDQAGNISMKSRAWTTDWAKPLFDNGAPMHTLQLNGVINTSTTPPTVPVQVRWAQGRDQGMTPDSQIRYETQVSKLVNGVWSTWLSAAPLTTSELVTVRLGTNTMNYYKLRGRAWDLAGNKSLWYHGYQFSLRSLQETPPSVSPFYYSGVWTQTTRTGAWGGSVRTSTQAGAKAVIRGSGLIGIVMPKRSELGTVKICHTGTTTCRTIDLSPASGLGPRQIVFVKPQLTNRDEVVITVVSGRVDLDAFVLFYPPRT